MSQWQFSSPFSVQVAGVVTSVLVGSCSRITLDWVNSPPHTGQTYTALPDWAQVAVVRDMSSS